MALPITRYPMKGIYQVTTSRRPTRPRAKSSTIHAVPPAAVNGEAPVEVPPTAVNGEAPVEETAEATKGDVYDNLDRLVAQPVELRTRQPLTKVPVKRPPQFFRTNPDPAYTMIVKILEYGATDMDREIYLVDPAMWDELKTDIRDAQLFLAVDIDGNPFIWPIKLPRDEDGRGASWGESSLEMAELAKIKWIKIKGVKSAGVYAPTIAEDDLGEPQWPIAKDGTGAFSFGQLLRKAFGNKHYVDTVDHPVVKKLRGRL